MHDQLPSTNKQLIRKRLRAARNALNPTQQKLAANRLATRLSRLAVFKRSRHIAIYLPSDGEINPLPLLTSKGSRLKQWYLPIIQPDGQLIFGEILPPYKTHGKHLNRNRFGIPEPYMGRRTLTAQRLDMICLPLVAFDPSGARLGMGGGFYDRSLSFTRSRIIRRPQLVGLAHHCQLVARLDVDQWDIALTYAVTDQAVWHFSN